jgi:THO complex subunit 2
LHGDIASLTLDVLNVIDHETLVNENNDDRQKLCSILKELENWLNDSMIKERLEIDTLQDCSLLKTKKIFYSRFIKVKTKLFYKQQKFNLLREENEGYAKLITELNQEIDDTITPLYILQVNVFLHIIMLSTFSTILLTYTGYTIFNWLFQLGSE